MLLRIEVEKKNFFLSNLNLIFLEKGVVKEEKAFILSARDLQHVLTQMGYKDPAFKKDSKDWFVILKEKKLLSKVLENFLF